MYNAIAQAFVNARHQSQFKFSLIQKADQHGKFKDGWSANLSYRTYQTLKAQGIMQ